MPEAAWDWARRRAPEMALAALAAVVFLGCLGAQDLWGKREQRSAAETIDTLTAGHWLVAEIQGRPRLEKPPLPRWTIAGLMLLTGRQDEWIVRLPSAAAALGMVALVYALGRRMAGRSVALASALALTACPFFVSELRQAGNDGPLAFFTTLAIYAAWRRLHGGPADEPPGRPADRPGPRGWAVALYGALGLGFLCKGPIVAVMTALAVVPYLAAARRLKEGARLLVDGRGLALFVALALSWPVPVVLLDPNAAAVWKLEMGQKAGMAGVSHHQPREMLALQWFWMTAPWSAIATWAVVHPLLRRGRGFPAAVWLPLSWAAANLAMFCSWMVAKPNYFLPCLPGAALLVGREWVRLCELARGDDPDARRARRFLLAHAVAILAVAVAGPVLVRELEPSYLGWSLVIAGSLAAGVVLGIGAWRRGADALAMAPLVGACAVMVLVIYGGIARHENPARSHRELARTIDSLLPPELRTVMFFHELDEGLWFYLRGRQLKAVPGSTPEYNDGFDMARELRRRQGRLPTLAEWTAERLEAHRRRLLGWMADPDRGSPYVLLRGKLYDQIAGDLAGHAEVVYRERQVKRNDVVLLRVRDGPATATRTDRPAARR
jgi:4-amino-4-deoxy-L-arabinose transferase-like glycosyltransferase